MALLSPLAALRAQQGINEEKYQLPIHATPEPMRLDGLLDEAAWQNARVAQDFYQQFPYDSSFAGAKTEVRVTFDAQNLYVGAVCYQARKYIVQSLKRDFAGGTSDAFIVNLDPFRDKLNGFNFAVSPLGVQREGLLSNGNELSTDWDNKWYVKVRNYDDRYVVEIAIPFKTLRYRRREGLNQWNINFVRTELVRNERSTWAPVPRNFPATDLTFSGTLRWETPPPAPGANVSVIPYLLASGDVDFLAKKPTAATTNAGFDAKVAVTPALNLDLTVNPDFAQVEVDRQQTNLSRFELFFPERRQFFIENSDLFGTFGFYNVNPFFSRRIGIKDGQKIPILAGARLSGRLNRNWRIGLLSMQTARRSEVAEPAANFGMVAVQRKVFSRSNVAFVFVNKQRFFTDSAERRSQPEAYSRIAGLDYNLASRDGRTQGKLFFHRAFTPRPLPQPYAAGALLNYSSTSWNVASNAEVVGKNYGAVAEATGYVPRSNYYRVEPTVSYRIYPKSTWINSYGVGVDGDWIWRLDDHRQTDWDFSPLYFTVQFQSSASLRITPLRWDYTYLFDEFDPTGTDGKALLAGSEYVYRSLRFTYASNTRRRFFFSAQGRIGGYFNGKLTNLTSSYSYRAQPYGIFSLDVNYNHIVLPAGYNSADLWLVGPRMELSFSKSLFLTTFFQYNNQVNNVNLNARLQWRFKPVSDLFVVYTDNYFATTDERDGLRYSALQSKNRALVLKLTYWLNI